MHVSALGPRHFDASSSARLISTHEGHNLTEYSHADLPASLCCAAVTQKPVPKPAQGEVLVRVTLRPINPVEAMCLAGAKRTSFHAAPPLRRMPSVA